ncbi:pyridoxal phosphate-dependent aminotransferase [Candidatus Bathyarchaeota archaeon]|nr:MAG: pyridoxal phosphate-dependent aminotransferase [Candidatus Bathyarchaeota archaeon]
MNKDIRMSSFRDEEIRFDLLRKYSANQWGRYPNDVIPLTAADPDYRAAEPIRRSIIDIAVDGVFSYGGDGGNRDFREACARHVTNRKGFSCSPEEIHALNGVAQGMMLTCKALVNPGDEVILFDPVDFLFGKSIDAAGGKRVLSKVDWETLEFDLEGLKELISSKTRMLCICNPHNPYGRVLRKDELKAMVDLAVEHDLWIMSDEIWSDIVYDGRKHIPTASLPGAPERTISLYGFSKTFAMAGLQLGFMVTQNPELMKRFRAAAPGYFYPVNNVSQVAGRAALEEGWGWAIEFVDHLEKVRDYVYKRLKSMPNVEGHKPEGTYVIFPKIQDMSSVKAADYLLEEAKVAVVPGHGEPFSYFGPGGEGHIRIVYSTGIGVMEEAMDRIESALSKL